MRTEERAQEQSEKRRVGESVNGGLQPSPQAPAHRDEGHSQKGGPQQKQPRSGAFRSPCHGGGSATRCPAGPQAPPGTRVRAPRATPGRRAGGGGRGASGLGSASAQTRRRAPDPPFLPRNDPAAIRADTLSFDPSQYEKQLCGEMTVFLANQPVVLPNNCPLPPTDTPRPRIRHGGTACLPSPAEETAEAAVLPRRPRLPHSSAQAWDTSVSLLPQQL